MAQQAGKDEALVHVQIASQFVGDLEAGGLRRAAAAALRLAPSLQGAGQKKPANLAIVVVDDEAMRRLNRDYRGLDSTTDVLSFGGVSDGFVSADEDEGTYLGDVIVSFPQAYAQAEARGHAVGAELALLVVHGVLHLLGYDHADAEQKEAMWRQQARVLQELGLQGVLPTEDD